MFVSSCILVGYHRVTTGCGSSWDEAKDDYLDWERSTLTSAFTTAGKLRRR